MMFRRCFRSPPKEATLEKLDETLRKFSDKENDLQKKIQDEVEKAKELTQAKKRKEARHCLERKRQYEAEIDKVRNYQERINEQKIKLRGLTSTRETFDALKLVKSEMKEWQKEITIDDVYNVIDEINEETQKINQIQEAFAKPIGAGEEFDEDELEAELQGFEREGLGEQLLQPAVTAPAAQYIRKGRQYTGPTPESSTND